MEIKYKNTKEDYYDALVALNMVEDYKKQRNKTIIFAILGCIGWYLILYPFVYGIYRIIGAGIGSVLTCTMIYIVNKNRVEREVKSFVSKDSIEVKILKSDIVIKRDNETIKFLLDNKKNYKLLELQNKIVVIYNEKILLIIPSREFKSGEEKEEFKSYFIS